MTDTANGWAYLACGALLAALAVCAASDVAKTRAPARELPGLEVWRMERNATDNLERERAARERHRQALEEYQRAHAGEAEARREAARARFERMHGRQG